METGLFPIINTFQPDVVVIAFDPSTQESEQVDLCERKGSLVYRGGAKPEVQEDPASRTKQNKPTTKYSGSTAHLWA